MRSQQAKIKRLIHAMRVKSSEDLGIDKVWKEQDIVTAGPGVAVQMESLDTEIKVY